MEADRRLPYKPLLKYFVLRYIIILYDDAMETNRRLPYKPLIKYFVIRYIIILYDDAMETFTIQAAP